MIGKILRLLVVTTLLASGPALATHVTDKLLAGMYSSPQSEGKPLQLLSSGTPVEVLERGDVFHKVRLEDGAEGWVNSAYLTEETPARTLLLEAQARIEELELSLSAAAAAATECPEAVAAEAPDIPDEAAVAAVAPVPADCSEIENELDALAGRVAQAASLLGGTAAAPATAVTATDLIANWPANWYWYALPVALLVGLVLGVLLMDYRSRQRYGGVRV